MDLFISPAPELLGRASIKIMEEVVTLHDATTFFQIFTAQFCWKTRLPEKKFRQLLKKFIKMKYLARIDDILLHVKAMLGPCLVWIFTLQK
jgi:hypothetical protein